MTTLNDRGSDFLITVDAKVVKLFANSAFQYEVQDQAFISEKFDTIDDYQTSKLKIAKDAEVEITFEGIDYADFLLISADGKFDLVVYSDTLGYGGNGFGGGGYGGGQTSPVMACDKLFALQTQGAVQRVKITNKEEVNALKVQVMAIKFATTA